MKLKLAKQEMMFLEDILLSAYFGLSLESGTEAHPKVRELLEAVQERLYRDI